MPSLHAVGFKISHNLLLASAIGYIAVHELFAAGVYLITIGAYIMTVVAYRNRATIGIRQVQPTLPTQQVSRTKTYRLYYNRAQLNRNSGRVNFDPSKTGYYDDANRVYLYNETTKLYEYETDLTEYEIALADEVRADKLKRKSFEIQR